MCFRKETATKAQYPDVSFGEDSEYAKRIREHIKTEKNVPKTLYFYDYKPGQSECK